MPKILAALTVILLMGMVITRVVMLKRRGVDALHFGKLDRTDFLIPPVALFYFYIIFANAFGWPLVSTQQFFQSSIAEWAGVGLLAAGLALMLASLISFGQSFRVGIDTDRPDKLVTSGVFAFTRNPIYVAFAAILLGQFLIFPNWILLAYTAGGFWLFHRQVLREEDYLQQHYGKEYSQYCERVRRYI